MTTPPTPPPATDPPADPAAPTVAQLAEKVDRLAALLTPSHGAAEQHTNGVLGRPTTVEEQVAAELKKQRDADAKAAAEAERDGTIKKTAAELAEIKAKLKESPPVQPQRLVERIMYGKRSEHAAK